MDKKLLLYCDDEDEVFSFMDRLEGFEARHFDFEEGRPVMADCVIMVLPYCDVSGGPRKFQADFFRKNREVKRWILLFTNVEGMYGAALSKWRQLNMELAAPMEILAGGAFGEFLPSLLDILQKDVKKCIIGYHRDRKQAEEFAQLLSGCIPEWKFEAVLGERLKAAFQKAGKLILFGRNPRDFRFPPIKINANKDLTLVYHCPGCIYENFYRQQCLASIDVLRKEGWDLTQAFSSYLLGNVRYEQEGILHKKRQEETGNLQEQKLHTLWDTYGLPYRSRELEESQISQFWSQFQTVEQIGCWLNR